MMSLSQVTWSSIVVLLPLTASVPLTLKHSAKARLREHSQIHGQFHHHHQSQSRHHSQQIQKGKTLKEKNGDHAETLPRLARKASSSMVAEISGAGHLGVAQHLSSHDKIAEHTNATMTMMQNLVADMPTVYPSTLPLNGNFEAGATGAIPKYWGQTQSSPGHLSDEQTHTGSKSLKLFENEELISGWDGSSCFAMERGNKYVLTFWAKSSSTESAIITQFLVFSRFTDTAFRRALRTKDKAFQMYHSIPTSSDWQKFSHEFTADEDSGKVRLILGCTSGSLWIDDLAFYQECPDIVSIAGAEDKQADSMGAYVRQLKGKYGQPIYKNANGMYLFFWGDYGSWLIGSDYKIETALLQSPNAISTGCPTSASGQSWSIRNHDGNWETRVLVLNQVA